MKRHFKFLHISDLHIGSRHPLCPPGESTEKRELFYGLSLKGLQRAVDLTNRESLDALLIAGDLVESSTLDYRVLDDVFRILAGCKAPVIIVPGNHDLYQNVYKRAKLDFYGIRVPENLFIFSSPSFTSFRIKGVNIYGMANTTPDVKPFNGLPVLNREEINIASFHGSLLSFLPPGKEPWLPFSSEDVIDAGFDYIALGHYHSYREIKDSEGIVRAAYSGSLMPTNRTETDRRGGLIVKIERKDGLSTVDLDFVQLAPFSVRTLELSITEEHSIEEIKGMILSELPQTERVNTYLIIRASGTGASLLERAKEEIAEGFLHIELDTSGMFSENMDSLLSSYNPESLTGRFVKAIKEEMVSAEPSSRIILRNALLYGLDALRGREIEPRYETEKIQG